MKSRPPGAASRVFRDPYCFLGFGFGSGLAPVAPGTFGTLVAVPIYWVLAGLDPSIYGSLVFVLFLAGIPICGRCGETLGKHDHSSIVWDEIVGYLITMAAVPFSWKVAAVGFVLFRVLDIFKPWPISQVDRAMRGGFGVMLDDALAGGVAAVCLHFALPFIEF